MKYKTYSDLSVDIKNNVHKINYQNFDLIVGIPRSGMVPAYMVSLLLNVHCIDFPSFIRNERLTKGITRKVNSDILYAHDATNILIVDDSILSGKSMLNSLSKIPSDFKGRVTTSAVYSSTKTHADVDIIFSQVELPRVFEWNIFNHPISENSCFDIDGVLCYDPSLEQNDDSDKYMYFLENATPKYIPTIKVDVLITNRLEKYREQTESWLSKYNVKYNRLIMLNLPNKSSRLNQVDYFSHKANFYKSSEHLLFIESDINQAIEIANRSGKFVFCVDDNIMISPGVFNRYKNKFISRAINKIAKNLKIDKFYNK